jgi:hypothetical protein
MPRSHVVAHRALVSALLFLLAAGCRKKQEPSSRIDPSPSVSIANSSGGPLAPRRDPSASASTQEKGSDSFDGDMAKGRAAMQAHRYDEAIAAFERAHRAGGARQRAGSELGYAQVLAGRAEAARRTLTSAWEDSFETRLRAEIAYNLGLAAEALHEPDKALTWFYHSQSLRPTQAAQSKIQGKRFCPLAIDTKPVPATEHAGWLKMIADLKLDVGDPSPKTDAEAEKLLCRETDCSMISVGPPDEGGPWSVERRFLRKIGANRLRVSEVFFSDTRPGWSMACHQSAVVDVKREGDLLHVISGGTTYSKGLGTDKGEHCASESETCSEDCFVTDLFRTDAYFDRATLTRLLEISQRTPCGSHCSGRERLLEAKIEGDDLTFRAMDGAVLRNPVDVKSKDRQVTLSSAPYCQQTIQLPSR